jgi:ribosome-associated protein
MLLSLQKVMDECLIKTSRSGGKGGQHVNKVSTKVELIFSVEQSGLFSAEEKTKLMSRLADKLDGEGFLHVVCQASRSQTDNKHTAAEKLLKLLVNALTDKKPRKATRPKKSAIEQRLSEKKRLSVIKRTRSGKPGLE